MPVQHTEAHTYRPDLRCWTCYPQREVIIDEAGLAVYRKKSVHPKADDFFPWIILDPEMKPPSMLCQRCGKREAIGMPISISFFGDVARLFIGLHKDCKAR